MLRFHVRRGRRDAGACASAERGWSFSTRGDLIPPFPLALSPSRKPAIGGGSLRSAITAFFAPLRSPTTPSTTTTARANDAQQHGDDVTQEAPSPSIQAGRTGGRIYGDRRRGMGMQDGRRTAENR